MSHIELIIVCVWFAGTMVGITITAALYSKETHPLMRDNTLMGNGVLMSIVWPAVILAGVVSIPFLLCWKLGMLLGNKQPAKPLKKKREFQVKEYKKQIAQLQDQLDKQKIVIAELRGYRD